MFENFSIPLDLSLNLQNLSTLLMETHKNGIRGNFILNAQNKNVTVFSYFFGKTVLNKLLNSWS